MKDTENAIFANEDIGDTAQSREGIYRKESRICGIRGESSSDFLLPDYMGDVKRLLKSTSEISVANKFAGNGEISFLLLVTYRVMYLDAEDVLTEAVFTSDYECTQKTESGFIDADIDAQVQNLSVRLQGPRKICAKVSLICDIRMSEEAEILNLPDISGAECRKTEVMIHKAEYIKFQEREYAEEIGRLEGVSADEVEIIKSDADISINSCRKSEDNLIVSGDVNAFALVKLGNDIIRVEKRLPIEETIVIDGHSLHMSYTPRGEIGSITANVNNAVSDNADAGVYASLVMNFTLDIYAVCDTNEAKTLVTDAYFCGKKNECSYKNFVYNELLGVLNERKKISLSAKRDETPIRNIIDYNIGLKNIRYMVKDCDVKIFGTVEYNFIVCTMQELEVKSVKGDCDFEENIRLPWQANKQKIKIGVTPYEISPGFDNENIYISATLLINAYEEETKSEKILSGLICEDAEEKNERCIIVYYPKATDTVWSVAKKYATSPYDIIKNNDLSDFSEKYDENLDNIKKIMIIKKG